jgi:integrase
MNENELGRLLAVARERPLLEALTVRKGKRKGERYACVRPEVRARLETLGRERALIYKALVLTGLRKGELASLTVAQLHLDGPNPYASLDAADEKNREGNDIPLRDDSATDLRGWLADKLRRLQGEAGELGGPVPVRLPPDAPVFEVPERLVKILDRDLVLAGIARRVQVGGKWKIDKRNERGRTIDVHALRITFGTLLSKGGVAPRTAQSAMRHSDIKLTMGVYTDPALLDVRGALDALPSLPLSVNLEAALRKAGATGTDGKATRALAPTTDNQGQRVSSADTAGGGESPGTIAASGRVDKRKGPLTIPVSGPCSRGERLRTSDLLTPFRGGRLGIRKGKPRHGLQIPHLPHFTHRIPYNPQIPGSFLQFPAPISHAPLGR